MAESDLFGAGANPDALGSFLEQKAKQDFQKELREKQFKSLIPGEVDPIWGYIKDQGKTWQDLEFNNFMERSIENNYPAGLDAIQQTDAFSAFLGRGSIRGDAVGQISESSILDTLSRLVRISETLSGTTTLSNGEQAVITLTSGDNQDPNRVILGVHHITPFVSSVGGANVIPYGSSVTATQWLWSNRADWNTNNNRTSSWTDFVYNVSAGASQTILWRAHVRYLGKTAS